jgi:hypothetical protein
LKLFLLLVVVVVDAKMLEEVDLVDIELFR